MDDGVPRPSSQGTYILAALWALVMLSAAVAPCLVPADGAAPGATATLAVLALLSLAALIAVWLLLQTLPACACWAGSPGCSASSPPY